MDVSIQNADCFDEDISELEPQSSSACHCVSETSECACGYDCSDEDSMYTGPEAEPYIEYKEMREERKRKLAEPGY